MSGTAERAGPGYRGNVMPLGPEASRRRCSVCALKGQCLPAGLEPDEVARFASLVTRCRTVQPGEYLCRVGDPFRYLHAVRSGCFKLFAVDPTGREQVMNFNFPGETIGIDAIYPERHVSNAVALVESSVCCIPFRRLGDLAREIPALQTRLLRLVSREVFSMAGLAGDFTAEERLAGFLVMVAARQGASDEGIPTHLQLPMCRQDIANYLRLATETVSRILARFQRSGLVRADRRHIELTDPAGLHEIAACMNPYSRCHPAPRDLTA